MVAAGAFRRFGMSGTAAAVSERQRQERQRLERQRAKKASRPLASGPKVLKRHSLRPNLIRSATIRFSPQKRVVPAHQIPGLHDPEADDAAEEPEEGPAPQSTLKSTTVDTAKWAVYRGASTQKTTFERIWVVDPRTSKWLGAWDLTCMFALCFVALVTPFEVSFLDSPKSWRDIAERFASVGWLFCVNRVVDSLFIVDLGLQFRLMYTEQSAMEGTKWVDDPIVIIKHYLYGWFALCAPHTRAAVNGHPRAACVAALHDRSVCGPSDPPRSCPPRSDFGSILVSIFDVIPLLGGGEDVRQTVPPGRGAEATASPGAPEAEAPSRVAQVRKVRVLRVMRVLRLIKLVRLLRASRLFQR